MSKVRCEKCEKKIKNKWLKVVEEKELKITCELCFYKDLSEYYFEIVKKQNLKLNELIKGDENGI